MCYIWTEHLQNRCCHYNCFHCRSLASQLGSIMARGQQKIQSQQKAAEKAAKLKKQVTWFKVDRKQKMRSLAEEVKETAIDIQMEVKCEPLWKVQVQVDAPFYNMKFALFIKNFFRKGAAWRTRRRLPWPDSSWHVLSAKPWCLTPRLTSRSLLALLEIIDLINFIFSTLRTSILRMIFQQTWKMFNVLRLHRFYIISFSHKPKMFLDYFLLSFVSPYYFI